MVRFVICVLMFVLVSCAYTSPAPATSKSKGQSVGVAHVTGGRFTGVGSFSTGDVQYAPLHLHANDLKHRKASGSVTTSTKHFSRVQSSSSIRKSTGGSSRIKQQWPMSTTAIITDNSWGKVEWGSRTDKHNRKGNSQDKHSGHLLNVYGGTVAENSPVWQGIGDTLEWGLRNGQHHRKGHPQPKQSDDLLTVYGGKVAKNSPVWQGIGDALGNIWTTTGFSY